MTSRFCTFPIDKNRINIWNHYKKFQASYWSPTVLEKDFLIDARDFPKLKAGEQKFLKYAIAFFAASDGIVNENISRNLIHDFPSKECNVYFNFCLAQEDVHGETYSRLAEIYIRDPIERDKIFRAIETMPCIKRKADWALKWMGLDAPRYPDELNDKIRKLISTIPKTKDNDEALKYLSSTRKSRWQRLLAHALMEGAGFQTSFASICIVHARTGLCPGFAKANEYISREENGHFEGAVILFNDELSEDERPTEKVAHEMVRSFYAAEEDYLTEMTTRVGIPDVNPENMKEYLKFILDTILDIFGYKKIYHAKQPFPIMEKMSITHRRDDFFKASITTYELPGSHDAEITDDYMGDDF